MTTFWGGDCIRAAIQVTTKYDDFLKIQGVGKQRPDGAAGAFGLGDTGVWYMTGMVTTGTGLQLYGCMASAASVPNSPVPNLAR